jgi:hypothetical protein
MALVRYQPGAVAPRTGEYALVGHYGEATNLSVWRERGEVLPTFTGVGESGPFWFVQVHEANEAAGVA